MKTRSLKNKRRSKKRSHLSRAENILSDMIMPYKSKLGKSIVSSSIASNSVLCFAAIAILSINLYYTVRNTSAHNAPVQEGFESSESPVSLTETLVGNPYVINGQYETNNDDNSVNIVLNISMNSFYSDSSANTINYNAKTWLDFSNDSSNNPLTIVTEQAINTLNTTPSAKPIYPSQPQQNLFNIPSNKYTNCNPSVTLPASPSASQPAPIQTCTTDVSSVDLYPHTFSIGYDYIQYRDISSNFPTPPILENIQFVNNIGASGVIPGTGFNYNSAFLQQMKATIGVSNEITQPSNLLPFDQFIQQSAVDIVESEYVNYLFSYTIDFSMPRIIFNDDLSRLSNHSPVIIGANNTNDSSSRTLSVTNITYNGGVQTHLLAPITFTINPNEMSFITYNSSSNASEIFSEIIKSQKISDFAITFQCNSGKCDLLPTSYRYANGNVITFTNTDISANSSALEFYFSEGPEVNLSSPQVSSSQKANLATIKPGSENVLGLGFLSNMILNFQEQSTIDSLDKYINIISPVYSPNRNVIVSIKDGYCDGSGVDVSCSTLKRDRCNPMDNSGCYWYSYNDTDDTSVETSLPATFNPYDAGANIALAIVLLIVSIVAILYVLWYSYQFIAGPDRPDYVVSKVS